MEYNDVNLDVAKSLECVSRNLFLMQRYLKFLEGVDKSISQSKITELKSYLDKYIDKAVKVCSECLTDSEIAHSSKYFYDCRVELFLTEKVEG